MVCYIYYRRILFVLALVNLFLVLLEIRARKTYGISLWYLMLYADAFDLAIDIFFNNTVNHLKRISTHLIKCRDKLEKFHNMYLSCAYLKCAFRYFDLFISFIESKYLGH